MKIMGGTTPSIIFTIDNEEFDMNQIKEVWFTIRNSRTEFTFNKDELLIDYENKTLIVELTQEQTLELGSSRISIQIRILTMDDKAWSTEIIKDAESQSPLKDGVIDG